MKLLMSIVLFSSLMVFAQEQPAAVQPAFMAVLQGFFDKIPLEGSIVMVAAGVIEFVLRLVKTEKPKSIMYLVADGFKLFGSGIQKVGMFLDKILPQRLK